jgi:hypothetical protein
VLVVFKMQKLDKSLKNGYPFEKKEKGNRD